MFISNGRVGFRNPGRFRILLGVLCLLGEHGFAQQATDQEMVFSALKSEFRVSSTEKVLNRLEEVRGKVQESINEKIAAGGDIEVAARVVFSEGQSPQAVEQFAKKFDIEVIRAEAKSPTGDEGVITTMSLGSRMLLMLDGTLAERLALGTSSQKLEAASYAEKQNDEAMLLDVLNAETKYYKIEFIGSAEQIERMYEDSAVQSILLSDDSRIQGYRAQQLFIEEMKLNGPAPIRVVVGRGERLEDKLPPNYASFPIINSQRLPSNNRAYNFQENDR